MKHLPRLLTICDRWCLCVASYVSFYLTLWACIISLKRCFRCVSFYVRIHWNVKKNPFWLSWWFGYQGCWPASSIVCKERCKYYCCVLLKVTFRCKKEKCSIILMSVLFYSSLSPSEIVLHVRSSKSNYPNSALHTAYKIPPSRWWSGTGDKMFFILGW